MTESLVEVPDTVLEIAEALREAERTGRPVPPPTESHPGLSLEDAYRVQATNVRHRRDAGERIVGHKVGLTSLAMQRQLGVDQPDFGIITDAMVVPDGGEFAPARLIAPRLEAEFAFRIGTDLPPAPSVEQLADAIEGVAVSIEIIDSRIADWRIGLADTVADNASSARIVYGEFVAATPALLKSLPDTVIALTKDGQDAGSGPGSAVLGDPLISLHWLSTTIGAYGDHFRRGQIVLAGAVAAAVPLTAGSVWQVTGEGFAPVTFTSI
ncbi:2-keto-4-pentenoate hydratase [Microbacterium azadirachtae]|uniref:2-keto-4-pentenoate hydratase n=1 Tax=Microbacterium azadirachtae TaxID=582680 RepID=A0A1I6G7Q4_9MICO|nr:fumarylacetoacetate hydrolase family protein [Microbacterium azadirachtae]SDL36839.1 2-keto-4-pentenoate hydratase [Microbacterium azadirachtae]SEF67639.1 2-keto-4-pentenoate hydratase [Microbacterium azadirachtae]SEF68399.1 2-keto-4-pentenoate hydratase [Microbacterium azadirachtae]SFR38222.1 2-keto-4-pentenoate hydratase [Microbacterium azadirachtae]